MADIFVSELITRILIVLEVCVPTGSGSSPVWWGTTLKRPTWAAVRLPCMSGCRWPSWFSFWLYWSPLASSDEDDFQAVTDLRNQVKSSRFKTGLEKYSLEQPSSFYSLHRAIEYLWFFPLFFHSFEFRDSIRNDDRKVDGSCLRAGKMHLTFELDSLFIRCMINYSWMCLQTCKYPGVHDPFRGPGEVEGKISAKTQKMFKIFWAIQVFALLQK